MRALVVPGGRPCDAKAAGVVLSIWVVIDTCRRISVILHAAPGNPLSRRARLLARTALKALCYSPALQKPSVRARQALVRIAANSSAFASSAGSLEIRDRPAQTPRAEQAAGRARQGGAARGLLATSRQKQQRPRRPAARIPVHEIGQAAWPGLPDNRPLACRCPRNEWRRAGRDGGRAQSPAGTTDIPRRTRP